jgi:DNA-binding Xre family transcriptional regulator
MYKKGLYFTRSKVKSFKSKPSKHITKALRLYNIDSVIPNKQLSKATGCSINALNKIVKKGEGAYYSSGSRPNQSAQSWGLARLASSLTSGKAAAVDFDILDKGCNHNKKAFRLALLAKKKYGSGRSKTKKVKV